MVARSNDDAARSIQDELTSTWGQLKDSLAAANQATSALTAATERAQIPQQTLAEATRAITQASNIIAPTPANTAAANPTAAQTITNDHIRNIAEQTVSAVFQALGSTINTDGTLPTLPSTNNPLFNLIQGSVTTGIQRAEAAIATRIQTSVNTQVSTLFSRYEFQLQASGGVRVSISRPYGTSPGSSRGMFDRQYSNEPNHDRPHTSGSQSSSQLLRNSQTSPRPHESKRARLNKGMKLAAHGQVKAGAKAVMGRSSDDNQDEVWEYVALDIGEPGVAIDQLPESLSVASRKLVTGVSSDRRTNLISSKERYRRGCSRKEGHQQRLVGGTAGYWSVQVLPKS